MTGGERADGHLGDRVSALLDGELDPAEEEEARSHLGRCPDCSAELDATRRMRALVRALPAVEPPRPLTGPARRRRAGAVGVAAAVAAAVASVLMTSIQSEGPEQPPVARLLETHATSLVNVEPLSQLAPAAVPLYSR